MGLGRFGMNLALRLEELGHTVMAIDERSYPGAKHCRPCDTCRYLRCDQ
ncbi:MAG: hypothetical protein M5U34_48465 [Chloroflexi bacterium]|nr:hypothetical protein [Chloroflexota bacterium]